MMFIKRKQKTVKIRTEQPRLGTKLFPLTAPYFLLKELKNILKLIDSSVNIYNYIIISFFNYLIYVGSVHSLIQIYENHSIATLLNTKMAKILGIFQI